MSSHIHKRLIIAAFATVAIPVAMMADSGITSSYFAPNSALSSGKWVKIKVSETGFQKITAEQLSAMGFSDPSRVAVCGYGISQLYREKISADTPDDLKAIPARYSADGDIVFYGEGPVSLSAFASNSIYTWKTLVRRNYYTDYGCYFLTDTVDPVTVAAVAAPDPDRLYATTHTTSMSLSFLEREEIFPEVGARAFFHDFTKEPVANFTFFLPGYRQSQPSEYQYHTGRTGMNVWTVMAVGATSSSEAVRLTYPAAPLNAGNLSFFRIRENEMIYRDAANDRMPVLVNPPVNDDNKYSVTIDCSRISTLKFGALDYMAINYRRNNDLADGGLQTLYFEDLQPNDGIKITNLPQNYEAWDITDPAAPRQLQIQPSETDGSVTLALDKRLNAYTGVNVPAITLLNPETDYKTVDVIGTVAPQNLHSMETPRMVIISGSSLMEQAERLANLHRDNDGIDVAVVNKDEIFNEFSSGISCPLGIRRFLKMLDTRTPGKLKSVLIFGSPNIDSRNLRGLLNDYEGVYIPMYQNPHIKSSGWLGLSYATDAVYGILSEDFTAHDPVSRNLAIDMDINVGRIPASDANQAKMFVDKLEKYLADNNSSSFSRSLLTSDAGARNSFYEQAEEISDVIKGHSPGTEITKAYNGYTSGEYMTKSLATSMAQGIGFWYYTGHASPGSLTGVAYGQGSPAAMPTDKPPFCMWATCRSIYIDHEDGIGEEALFSNKGGAIGIVGATREVYKDPNQVLALGVTDQYFKAKPGDTMGDVWRMSRNAVCRAAVTNTPNDSTVVINTASYNFIGDPEVRMRVPSGSVTLSSVAGSSEATVTVEPLTKFTVTGTVNDESGINRSFNGMVTLAVNDAPISLSHTEYEEGNTYTHSSVWDNERILSVQVPVTAGEFSAEIMVPTPARSGQKNPVWMTAVANDGTTAYGSYDGLVISDLAANFDESQYSAPEITALYLNDETFANGDAVNGSPVLMARFAAPSGGNYLAPASSLLGQSMQIIIDDNKTLANAGGMVKFAEDGTASLEYPLSDLSDGYHTLKLKVRNVAGISAERSIEFVVVNTPISATLTVEDSPAVTSATIALDHTLDQSPEATLIIADAAGNTVFSQPATSFPFTWDLKDNNGNDAPKGRYTVKAMLHSGLRYGSATPAELIIVR